ncbi:replicative DNA helicase [Aminicella lysinilytica]|uniref:Replicative DNA helicase n=1 Tax=Aminicella lysinilytica TaxID=433323 RepID=A0A4R6QA56_9FIRM|nr:replicative DNA helicase [Aminicella lysinilytica]TDP58977.1 primary replicative DNA helicase [Aminicella lysinilytica]
MAEKIPPHNLEAERSVLGAGLLSRDALADIVEVVKPEDFYDGSNKEIFTTMLDMFRENKPVDIVTVCDELKRRKALEAVGGRSYVATLSSDVPSTTNAGEYAKIVAEKASMRQLIHTAEEIRERAFEENQDTNDILDHAEKSIFDIAQSRQSNDYSALKDVLLTDMSLIDEAIKNKGQVTGITTGFKRLDEVTSGLQRSDLVIVAARPSMGKTAFALNIAQNAAVKGNASVLMFSLEMSKEQLGQRLLAMESKVDMENIKKGKIERADWDRIMLAVDTLSGANIQIDDSPALSVFEIKNKCRRMKAEHGLDLVVIDYLQLMRSEGKAESRQQEISNLSRYLKLLAREMDCPVIVLSQLSRAPEQRPNHRPVLSDLRESGSIEQDADIVIFLYRDDYYNEDSEKPGVCEVNLAKHRSGPTGSLELTWVARYTKFSDKA